MRDRIPGVILAGGAARRMGGGDKGLREVAGKPLIRHVMERLAGQCAPIALSANGDPKRFGALGLEVIPDSLPDRPGPLAGVLAGLDWAAGIGAPAIITAAADTPFLPRDLALRLIEAGGGTGRIVLAASPDEDRVLRRHPTFGLWPVALRDDLRAALEEGLRKVVIWTEGHGATMAAFSATPFDPFFNVNTPEDIARAEVLAGLA